MQKKQPAGSKQSRKGDTSRTSSQGRKLSSGPKSNKKGSPDMNEDTTNPVREEQKKRKIPGSKGVAI